MTLFGKKSLQKLHKLRRRKEEEQPKLKNPKPTPKRHFIFPAIDIRQLGSPSPQQ
jgi:hypothetical protein